MEELRTATKVKWNNLKERDHLADLGMNVRTILK
jgi:hypothetical protein